MRVPQHLRGALAICERAGRQRVRAGQEHVLAARRAGGGRRDRCARRRDRGGRGVNQARAAPGLACASRRPAVPAAAGVAMLARRLEAAVALGEAAAGDVRRTFHGRDHHDEPAGDRRGGDRGARVRVKLARRRRAHGRDLVRRGGDARRASPAGRSADGRRSPGPRATSCCRGSGCRAGWEISSSGAAIRSRSATRSSRPTSPSRSRRIEAPLCRAAMRFARNSDRGRRGWPGSIPACPGPTMRLAP